MIVIDSGPLISFLNGNEGRRTDLARLVVGADPHGVIVPWPVFTEVDLFLRRRGQRRPAQALAETLLNGGLRLEPVAASELATAVALLRRYGDIDLDVPDAVVMAMSAQRGLSAFTWDFRHFRAVTIARGVPIPLVVEEHQLFGRK
ncbi:MAG: type II toxin-antitoxin system VapC family toxin [Dehalococcoidia bacterium]